MTLKIEVFVPEDDVRGGSAAKYLASALTAIGYSRQSYPAVEQSIGRATADGQPLGVQRAISFPETQPPTTVQQGAGEPEKPKSTRSSKKVDAKPANISTGEERVGPEDTPEAQAQDAADEAAEHAGKTTLTLDDVRKAVGRYTKKHGMAAAAKDVPAILGCAIADLPDDQGKLADAVAWIDQATEQGFTPPPAGENAFDEAPAEQKEFTKDDVKAAMLAYGEKFDKTTDPAAMAFTKIDIVKIFTTLFGADVKTFSQIPATSEACGRAVDAINRAIAEDPFQRGA